MVGRLALPSLGMRGCTACTRESLRSWTLSMQLQTPRSMCLPCHCQMGNGTLSGATVSFGNGRSGSTRPWWRRRPCTSKEAALALKAITTLRKRARAIAQACEWLRALLPETSLICLIYVYNLSPLGRAFASQHKRRVPKRVWLYVSVCVAVCVCVWLFWLLWAVCVCEQLCLCVCVCMHLCVPVRVYVTLCGCVVVELWDQDPTVAVVANVSVETSM